jgi:hypothetical protein
MQIGTQNCKLNGRINKGKVWDNHKGWKEAWVQSWYRDRQLGLGELRRKSTVKATIAILPLDSPWRSVRPSDKNRQLISLVSFMSVWWPKEDSHHV